MDVDEVEPGNGAEMAQQARFHMFVREWLREKWVVEQVDLADRQVVGGAPIRVDRLELAGGERAFCGTHPSIRT